MPKLPELYLESPSKAEFVQEIGELMGGSFERDFTKDYGATDSANKVFFGKVNDTDVAVKPYAGLATRSRAWHEAGMMELVTQLGFSTFKPVGVYEGSLAAYLVTEFMPGISTMNQVGWEQSTNPFIYNHSHLPLLRRFGAFVGSIQAQDLTHGDLQPKNVPRRRNGQFMLVDLEKLQFCKDMAPEQKIPAIAYDIGRLASGLLKRGFLHDKDWPEIESVLTENYVTPCLNEIQNAGVDTAPHLLAIPQAFSLIKLSHSHRN